MKFNLLIAAIVAASMLASTVRAENSSVAMPGELVAEVLENSSSKTGEIAAAPLDTKGTWLVYLKTKGSCGTGGCRAQVWQKTDEGFELVGKLPASFLPIRQLPQNEGAQSFGITSYEMEGPAKVIPVIKTEDGFAANWDKPMSEESGLVLISEDMLKTL